MTPPPEKLPFAPALRSLLEEEARSEHPTAERLIDYQSGWLSQEEAGRVEAHLRSCQECTGLLADLAAFEEHVPAPISAAQPDREAKAAWQRLSEQLPKSADSKIRLVPPPPRRQEVAWWRRPQTAYALAAGLFCGVIGLTVWGMNLRQQLVKQKEPQVNTALVELDPVDEGTRGIDNKPVLAAPNSLLLLHSLDTFDGELRVEIVDPKGEIVWRNSELHKTPQGDYTIQIGSGYLPAGSYRLKVYAATDRNAPPLKEYPLEIGP